MLTGAHNALTYLDLPVAPDGEGENLRTGLLAAQTLLSNRLTTNLHCLHALTIATSLHKLLNDLVDLLGKVSARNVKM